MSGTTSSGNISDIYGYPVPDTWVEGQTVTVDWLNRNVRDVQKFLAYAPITTVYRNATQSLGNGANTAVTFDTEVVDVDGIFSPPSTNLTIKRPGLYEIQTVAFFASSAAGALRALHIDLNGSHTYSLNAGPSSSGTTVLNCGGILPLNQGDVITQVCFQNSGGSLNVGGDPRHRLSVRLLSTSQTDVTFTPGAGSTSSGSTPGSSGKPTPPKPTKHTATFYATWSRTYNGNGATTWDDSKYCYQGYYSSARGNTRSLIGFNYGSIESTLAGATNITGRFGYKVAHSYYGSGLTAVMGSHNYTSKPSTWSTSRVFEDQGKKANVVAGRSYSVPLSSWQCWAWKTGNITGMAFGPGPNSNKVYYGYFYGATQGGKPYVQFTYYK